MAGKVALVSGAARGQGRNHAMRLAEEGSDIIAFDVAGPVPAQGAPPATPADLAETVSLMEKLDRRIVATQADARDPDAVAALVERAESPSSAGSTSSSRTRASRATPARPHRPAQPTGKRSSTPTVSGVFHTIRPAIPHLVARSGGAIIITSSSIGLRSVPNLAPYAAAKAGLTGLMRTLALELAEHSIRANSVNPTGTPILLNPVNFGLFRPDLENPTEEDVRPVYRSLNALPVPYMDPDDISNAVLLLASDDGRYITGVALPVDAGYAAK